MTQSNTRKPNENVFLEKMLAALAPDAHVGDAPAPAIEFLGDGELPSYFAFGDLAEAAVAAAGDSLARYIALSNPLPDVAVDRPLANRWFKKSIRPIGWTLPPQRDVVTGDYATADGWIRLHMNLAHHRAAALHVLESSPDRSNIAEAVRKWQAVALETAVVENGGAAAAMRDIATWNTHPQGQAVASEPHVAWHHCAAIKPDLGTPVDAERPLAGLRVLDLTRILAGPVSTRFLAAYGAEILRVDPPGWTEPPNIPEMTPGKRCTTLDLKTPEGQQALQRLAAEADLMVHGYRSDALVGVRCDPATLRERNPALIDVALDAYGWTGPWSKRRGFDSLVQMSSGIADFGMQRARIDRPMPLPAQGLDHATGYLLAAAALRALELRKRTGEVASARLSLAATAGLLIPSARSETGVVVAAEAADDVAPETEVTDWGQAQRLKFPVRVGATQAYWATPARALHSDPPEWA